MVKEFWNVENCHFWDFNIYTSFFQVVAAYRQEEEYTGRNFCGLKRIPVFVGSCETEIVESTGKLMDMWPMAT